MPTPLTVRPLQAADVPLLRRMLDLFGRAFDEMDTYGAAQPDDAYLQRLLAGDSFVAIVALRQDEVVGALAGYVLPKFEQRRFEFYLYDLAVAETHRRQGVATALIAELRRVAARRGIGVIFVQADAGDEPAIALYGTLGRGEGVLHFDIDPLDDPA